MAAQKTEKVSYDKQTIQEIVGELKFIEGFLEAKLQTGQADKLSKIIAALEGEYK